jgi:hypothetical protein
LSKKQLYYKDKVIFKNISVVGGFGNLQLEIENELQPWEDTPEYVGAFVDGLKHGAGRFIYPNGDIYKGGFQKNKRHGNGVMMFRDGRFYKG